jgi:hypothetical protein
MDSHYFSGLSSFLGQNTSNKIWVLRLSHPRFMGAKKIPGSISRNKIIQCILKNQLCGIACYRKIIITAWKDLKNEPYPYFVWMESTDIRQRKEALTLAILDKNEQKCSKRPLCGALWELKSLWILFKQTVSVLHFSSSFMLWWWFFGSMQSHKVEFSEYTELFYFAILNQV